MPAGSLVSSGIFPLLHVLSETVLVSVLRISISRYIYIRDRWSIGLAEVDPD